MAVMEQVALQHLVVAVVGALVQME